MVRLQDSFPLSLLIASRSTQLFQDKYELMPAQCALRHERHGLVGGVIHHSRVLFATSLGRAVEHEIHGSHLVGCRGTLQRIDTGDLFSIASIRRSRPVATTRLFPVEPHEIAHYYWTIPLSVVKSSK